MSVDIRLSSYPSWNYYLSAFLISAFYILISKMLKHSTRADIFESDWLICRLTTMKYEVYEVQIFVKTYWNTTTTTYIYTPSVNGNAKPTHTVRLVASLSSSIK